MYLLVTVLLVTTWRGRLQGGLLVSATTVSALWCLAAATQSTYSTPPLSAVQSIETLRTAAWFLFLFRLSGLLNSPRDARRLEHSVFAIASLALCGALIVYLVTNRAVLPDSIHDEYFSSTAIIGHLVLTVIGLMLVEQLFRNTRVEHRWAIKFLCLGLGGIFVYDLYLYSNALLFNRLDEQIWAARGIVHAFVVPLIAVSAARNPNWSLEIFVSRHVVFHSAALLGTGAYLLCMAGAGYYIRLYGGAWGDVAQVGFLFAAVVLLFLLLSSSQLRSRARVFLGKHFFKNRYDYRDEWLGFTQILSTRGQGAGLRENIIRAIAAILESPGGVMWVKQAPGEFQAVSAWRASVPDHSVEAPDSSLVTFLARTGWILYLDELKSASGNFADLELPVWCVNMPGAAVIVPLLHQEELYGIVILLRSQTRAEKFNWEDSDLLKTVGRQAASYLALMQVTEALTDARQFEVFNRLSAFVVHDLKNLVAQLSLVVSNAKRHMHSPGFLEDAFATVENATEKMNRLLAQLRKDRGELGLPRQVILNQLLQQVTDTLSVNQPSPKLILPEQELCIIAEQERLTARAESLALARSGLCCGLFPFLCIPVKLAKR